MPSNLTENVIGLHVLLKGAGVLAGAAALVVLGVLGLARLTVPDEAQFSEAFEDDHAVGGGEFEFAPTAVGARLEISGAREATVTLDRTVDGPSFGLGDSTTRVFFDSGPLAIEQMSHDGLAFFPEPEDCELTPGQLDEDTGLVGVAVSCPELVDIRDNGSVSMSGYIALPADLVIELDLPERGGAVSIGDETIAFGADLHLFVGPSLQEAGSSDIQLTAVSESPLVTLVFPYDIGTGRLRLGRVGYSGGSTDIDPDECDHEASRLAVVNPQVEIVELTFSCPEVQLANVGRVPIEGTLVFEQIFYEDQG